MSRKRAVVAIKDGKLVSRYESITAAADAMDTNPSAIRNTIAGYQKTCRGCEWMYAEDWEEDHAGD